MSTWHIQSLRFIIVGLVSNLVLYLLYLVLTAIGLGHKTAMTMLYLAGILQTFIFNKRWSFSHRGAVAVSLRRYLILYGILYIINFFVLIILVDFMEFSPAFVQAGIVLTFVPLVFLGQRYWVFAPDKMVRLISPTE